MKRTVIAFCIIAKNRRFWLLIKNKKKEPLDSYIPIISNRRYHFFPNASVNQFTEDKEQTHR